MQRCNTVKSVDIRKALTVNSIQQKVREMRIRWYGHMQRMEENNEVRAIVDKIVPGKRLRGRPSDDPGGCPGQNIFEINTSRR